MPRRRTDYRGLLERNRVRLLGHIQGNPGCTLQELSEATDIPINTARDHLWTLQEEGFIVANRVSTGKRGRPPLAYFPAREAESSPAAKERLQRIDARREQLRNVLGARNGAGSALERQLDVLYEHFEDVGLSPTVLRTALAIEVSPGEHLDLYEESADLVSGVHRALIEDTLGHTDGPLVLGEIKPFVNDDECLVILYLKETAPEGLVVKSCAERIKPV